MKKCGHKSPDRATKRLQFCFDLFNQAYFDGNISDISVSFGSEKEMKQCDGLSTATWILIHEDFKKHLDMGVIILLHEMQHVYMAQNGYRVWKDDNDGHHMIFYAGIDKLYKKGAYEGLL